MAAGCLAQLLRGAGLARLEARSRGRFLDLCPLLGQSLVPIGIICVPSGAQPQQLHCTLCALGLLRMQEGCCFGPVIRSNCGAPCRVIAARVHPCRVYRRQRWS